MDYYRYNDNDSRPFFLNSQHYAEAHDILHEQWNSFTSQLHGDPARGEDDETSDRVSALIIPEENRRLPVDGYFSFYSDLLGFTAEVARGGMDSLPDYFGGGLTASYMNPSVQVYLLSDSCMAFASSQNATAFVSFVTIIVTPAAILDGCLMASFPSALLATVALWNASHFWNTGRAIFLELK